MYAAVNRVNTTIARVAVDGARLDGTKNPNATFASSNNTYRGAPRMISMYIVHIHRTSGRPERRPSASSTPSGKHRMIEHTARKRLSRKPPHSSNPTAV